IAGVSSIIRIVGIAGDLRRLWSANNSSTRHAEHYATIWMSRRKSRSGEQSALEYFPVVLKIWCPRLRVFADIVVTAQAHRIHEVRRGLECGHLLGAERPALAQEALRRSRRERCQIGGVDRA